MVELEKPRFDVAASWRAQAWGEESSNWRQRKPSFAGRSRGLCILSSKGPSKSHVVAQPEKKLPSRSFPQETLWAKRRSRNRRAALATATAITACTTLRISREEMIRVMHTEHSFSDLFLKVILERSMRIQADLVDQLFNSSEKRLARILLLMAEFGKPGEPEQYIPKVSQETLAEMIGTTRSRVSFFMNRFASSALSNTTGASRFTSRC